MSRSVASPEAETPSQTPGCFMKLTISSEVLASFVLTMHFPPIAASKGFTTSFSAYSGQITRFKLSSSWAFGSYFERLRRCTAADVELDLLHAAPTSERQR